MTFVPQILSKNFENLIFVFKLLTVSFCFSIFVVYLVMVKFFILFKYVICFCRQLCWILASIQKLMLSIRRKSAVILFLLSIQTCAACFFVKRGKVYLDGLRLNIISPFLRTTTVRSRYPTNARMYQALSLEY